MIPYGKQDISIEDINSVVEVLKSPFLTQGSKVPEFEDGLCKYTGARYCSVVNSATSALHLAYKALGVVKGDIVWTTPLTFVATSNTALMCDAIIDFVDVKKETLNMSIDDLEEKLRNAKLKGKLPKVVVPVHMCGQSCDMEAVNRLSIKYGFKVIEDASHAVGGSYNGSKVGSCRYSDITIFSFHPVKIITSAEGGALLTNSPKLDRVVKLLRSHGIAKQELSVDEGPWYYEQNLLGYNYRMTEIQAALGLSQLARLDEFVSERNKIAKRYMDKFDTLGVGYLEQSSISYSSFHLFVIKVDPDRRRSVFEKLRSVGIGVQVHYFPVHKQLYYKRIRNWSLPASEAVYEEIISIPIYFTLSQKEQDFVISEIVSAITLEV